MSDQEHFRYSAPKLDYELPVELCVCGNCRSSNKFPSRGSDVGNDYFEVTLTCHTCGESDDPRTVDLETVEALEDRANTMENGLLSEAKEYEDPQRRMEAMAADARAIIAGLENGHVNFVSDLVEF
ncbi:MAG TPA: hypothetical protein VLG27_04435 [Candidatus Saccharimonadia bacterium]|nr:hypothetical protein [Candidatus Saccharimonadia bacterium]